MFKIKNLIPKLKLIPLDWVSGWRQGFCSIYFSSAPRYHRSGIYPRKELLLRKEQPSREYPSSLFLCLCPFLFLCPVYPPQNLGCSSNQQQSPTIVDFVVVVVVVGFVGFVAVESIAEFEFVVVGLVATNLHSKHHAPTCSTCIVPFAIVFWFFQFPIGVNALMPRCSLVVAKHFPSATIAPQSPRT